MSDESMMRAAAKAMRIRPAESDRRLSVIDGTVVSASDGTLSVRPDGADVPLKAEAYCSASSGDRVALILRPDGRCIALGRRGGESWETLPGRPSAFPADHLRGSAKLTEGADLNDVLTPGAYRIENYATAQKIANVPAEIKSAMHILVYKGAFASCTTQEVTSWANGISARRSYKSGDKTWTDWVYYGGTSSVVASGTSGSWRYIKWSDGRAECWGRYEAPISCSNAYGAGYYSNGQVVSLPFAFAEPPLFWGSTAALSFVAQDTGVADGKRIGFYVMRFVQGGVNYVDLMVRGRWK